MFSVFHAFYWAAKAAARPAKPAFAGSFLAPRRWGFAVLAAALAAALLSACGAQTPITLTSPSDVPTITTLTTTIPPTETLTLAPSLTVAPSATPTPPPPSTCSPLEGISLSELGGADLLKNPFQGPRPGFDDGHHGADFAYWTRGERTTMLGLPVHAVLSGKVAGVVQNRKPYGYAVIIETPLDALPPGWVEILPSPAPTVQPAESLLCPPAPAESIPANSGTARSLYLLYAHLNEPPLVAPGDSVGCGQQIGAVGTTGSSVNPHLHLETRVGPAGARFATLAHYDNAAAADEMGAYCAWRVSGLYQMLDPLALLSLQP